MRSLRGVFVGLLIVGLVIAAVIVVVGAARRRPKRNPRRPASTPTWPPAQPEAGVTPVEDAGLRDLEELGLLEDLTATPGALTEGATVGPAVEAVDGDVEIPVAASDTLAADVVSRALLNEVTAALSDVPAGVVPVEPVGVGAAPGNGDELSVAVEIELEVAELAAEPAQPAEDATLAEFGEAALLADVSGFATVAPGTAEPVAIEEPGPATVAEVPPETAESAAIAETPAAVDATPRGPSAGAARAEALLDEGNAYFNVGQYALAIGRYTEAVDLDPGLVAALYNRANARTRLGDYEAALADYDAALALNPRDTDALNNRGMLHLHRGDHAAALADLNAALAIDPHDTTVVVNRGLVHLQAGDARVAFDDFAEAARIDPRDASAHYGAAQASALLGDAVAALNSLRNAFRLDSAYVREAAADPHLASLQADPDFARLLRESGR